MMTTSVSEELQERLRVTREDINQAAINVGRNPAEITLLPLTKTFPPEVISQALSLGEVRFGENKAQELRDKAQALTHPELQWVMIGYLQSNKIGRASCRERVNIEVIEVALKEKKNTSRSTK